MSENGQDKLLEKTVMPDEMDAGMTAELTDDELEAVSGGRIHVLYRHRQTKMDRIYDGKGRCCGLTVDKKVMYRKCPGCGKPLYTSNSYFRCDVCKNQWGWIELTAWNGTKESLIAFANTNA